MLVQSAVSRQDNFFEVALSSQNQPLLAQWDSHITSLHECYLASRSSGLLEREQFLQSAQEYIENINIADFGTGNLQVYLRHDFYDRCGIYIVF